MSRAATWLERVAIALASVALSLGLIAALSGFFAGRDQANLGAVAGPPGQAFRDQGDARLTPGAPRPAYDSSPPTSGAHFPVPVLRDESRLSDDQLLEALARGDVVVLYPGPRAPPELEALARSLAAPFSPALAAAGQAVILAPFPGSTELTALAWAHLLRATSAGDPALRQFVEYWLGRGAGMA
ncbi:MAG TPA: DUF3105 domain-containing protein [Solirubrobacteraceae bacterium]|nr:DUF3105 domain-containing protein [Solirubrobacteraceae bacterium]